MGDPFLDLIDKALDNGEVPQKVTNRHLLAALRIMDDKIDTQAARCETNSETNGNRIGLLERWQSKATGAIAAAMFLSGGGLLITLLKIL